MPSLNNREMNFSRLVERIVPLVAELMATLAAKDPVRMYFANIADKTLLDIVETLRKEGISNEAIASSLGKTISGFYRMVSRLREEVESEEKVDGPRTLMEQVFSWVCDEADRRVEDEGAASTAEIRILYTDIEQKFKGVRRESLKSVLFFLVQYDMVGVSGRSDRASYWVVPRRTSEAGYHDAVVTLYREGPMSLSDLSVAVGLPERRCQDFLDTLSDEGLLDEEENPETGEPNFRARSYHIPVGAPEGFEAALWDHLQAVLRAISKKVRLAKYGAKAAESVGGSTFSYDLPADHPLTDEISEFLTETRARLEDWMERARPLLDSGQPLEKKVTIYIGQVDEHSS